MNPVKLSKKLSRLLRHRALEAGLSMRADGYVSCQELLALGEFSGVSFAAVERVVNENDKQRFSLLMSSEEDGVWLIRANQGHTVKCVDPNLLLTAIRDPSEVPVCVHGTHKAAWTAAICREGLSRMRRNHIHFAVGAPGERDVISGMRRSCTVLVYVDVAAAMADGIAFFRSANNVILSPGVGDAGIILPRYFERVVIDGRKIDLGGVGQKQTAAPEEKSAVADTHKSSKRAAAAAAASPNVIDIGVNLTNRQFKKDAAKVVHDAAKAHVSPLILTGTSIRGSRDAAALAARLRSSEEPLFFTAGVHPHDSKTWDAESASAIREMAANPLCVSVGECGLDFNRDFSPRALQEAAFAEQVELACELGKPLFCHERDAHERFVAVVEPFRGRLPPLVVHCFTGTAAEAQKYLEMGFYIGLTGTVCMPGRGRTLREQVLPAVPLERLMVETDAPFMHPNSGSGAKRRRCEPRDAQQVVATIASVLGRSVDEVAATTTANARRFFSLPEEEPAAKNSPRLPPPPPDAPPRDTLKGLFLERAAFVRGNAAAGQEPNSEQLATFMRQLCIDTGSRLAGAPESSKAAIRARFANVGWETTENCPTPGTGPPTLAAVMAFVDDVLGLIDNLTAAEEEETPPPPRGANAATAPQRQGNRPRRRKGGKARLQSNQYSK